MILSDLAILDAMAHGDIVITPFDRANLGTNSYDVHLGPRLAMYMNVGGTCAIATDRGVKWSDSLDSREQHVPYFDEIDAGMLLEPGMLYLGSTVEYTETHKHVPFLDGKSSIGRLGIFVHATAGRGDVGFCNHWTLEISVVHPVVVYAGMPIGQLIFFEVSGEVGVSYDKKPTANYNTRTPDPQPSKLWKWFERQKK